MAIDIEALKAKLDKMNGVKGTGSNRPSDLWKPEYGTYTIRVVPWPQDRDVPDRPFVEKWFYYDLPGRSMCAPGLDEEDPVRDLRNAMYEDRTEANLAVAKKLRPKMRSFIPIIVRGDDEETVMIWSIGQGVYKQLLGYLIDPDWGDITDIESGRDLTVKIGDSGKKFPDGKPIPETTVSPKPTPTKLSDDPKKLKLILENVPDVDDIYKTATVQELTAALDRFANGTPTGTQETRGGSSSDSSSGGGKAPSTSSLDDEFDQLLNV